MNNKFLNDEKIFIKLLKKIERAEAELGLSGLSDTIIEALALFAENSNGNAESMIVGLTIQFGMERHAKAIINLCKNNPRFVHDLTYPLTFRAFKRRNP